jgi:hypothetical protein
MERNKKQNESRQKIYNRADQNTSSKLKKDSSEPASQVQIHYLPEPEIQISEEPV